MAFPIHRPRRLRRTEALRAWCARRCSRPSDFIYPALRRGGSWRSDAGPVHAGNRQPVGGPGGGGGEAGASSGRAVGHPLRHPRPQGPARYRGLGGGWHRAEGAPGAEGLGPRAAAHRRHLPLRVHRPRALRGGPWRRGGQRPEPALARPDGGVLRPGGRGHRRPVRHDGRAGPGHPLGAGRGQVSPGSPSSATRRSTPPDSTGRSARRPRVRPSSAIAAATRWTRATSARR